MNEVDLQEYEEASRINKAISSGENQTIETNSAAMGKAFFSELMAQADGNQLEKVKKYFYQLGTGFVERLPVADSIVRLDQEHKISDLLIEGRPVAVRGFWRMGKTSMLEAVEKYSSISEIKLFVEPQIRVNPQKEFSLEFAILETSNLIAKIENEAGLNVDQNNQEEVAHKIEESGLPPLVFLAEYLQSKGKTAVIFVDEVIKLKNESEVSFIAGLSKYSSLKICAVLHQNNDDEATYDRYFADYEQIYVRKLNLDEVREILHRPLKDSAVMFTESAVQWIYEFTGGRPMEVQNVGREMVVNATVKNQTAVIDSAILENSKRSLQRYGGPLSTALENYRKVYEHALSELQMKLVTSLAKAQIVRIGEIDLSIVQPLINCTWITEVDGNYQLNGELLKMQIIDMQPFEE